MWSCSTFKLFFEKTLFVSYALDEGTSSHWLSFKGSGSTAVSQLCMAAFPLQYLSSDSGPYLGQYLILTEDQLCYLITVFHSKIPQPILTARCAGLVAYTWATPTPAILYYVVSKNNPYLPMKPKAHAYNKKAHPVPRKNRTHNKSNPSINSSPSGEPSRAPPYQLQPPNKVLLTFLSLRCTLSMIIGHDRRMLRSGCT